MISRKIVSATIVALLVVGVGLWFGGGGSQKNSATTFEAVEDDSLLKSRLVTIGSQTYVAEVAESAEEQAQGLSGRTNLSEAAGMLFPFSPPRTVSFWMKDMLFAIDIVWIAEGKVVGVVTNAPQPESGVAPQDLPTYEPPQPVDYVLELIAGQSQFFNVGDTVTISRLEST